MARNELLTIRLQAEALIDSGRFPEAADLLTRALSMAPNDGDVLCLMSQVLLALKQTGQAASYAEKALAVNPENTWAHRLRSLSLRQSNRHESLKSAKQAVQLDPQDPWCWHVLATAHLQVFNLDEAQKAAERLRALAPEWHVSHQALSLVALKQEKYKEAESHCRRELELNPNSYEGMNNLGVALLNQKRKREAIEAFNRAAKINPAAHTARSNINAAVGKYLPRITIPFFAIWIFINGLRVLGEKGQLGMLLTAGLLMASLIGSVFVVRWYRFRRLPAEVKAYVGATNQSGKLLERRKWLVMTAQITGALLVIVLLMALGFWLGDIPPSGALLITPAVIAAVFVGSLIALRRSSRRI